MIVITGATGALNGTTTRHLLARVTANRLAVVARDPSKAQALADRGVDVRYGDFTNPATLPGAFADAEQLLLVSSNDPSADAVALHRAAIEAAVDAGVGRILYTSHQGAASDSPFGPARDHAATEEILEASGTAWTSLRNGFYMHSLDWLLGPWRDTGDITVPADGPVSWTSRTDAAEAAATIILSDGAYEGPVTITAGTAPTFAQIADMASDVTGRRIGFELVDSEQWVATQLSSGSPEPAARLLLGMYQAADAGFFAGTDPLLRTLLDREPQSVQGYLTHPETVRI